MYSIPSFETYSAIGVLTDNFPRTKHWWFPILYNERNGALLKYYNNRQDFSNLITYEISAAFNLLFAEALIIYSRRAFSAYKWLTCLNWKIRWSLIDSLLKSNSNNTTTKSVLAHRNDRNDVITSISISKSFYEIPKCVLIEFKWQTREIACTASAPLSFIRGKIPINFVTSNWKVFVLWSMFYNVSRSVSNLRTDIPYTERQSWNEQWTFVIESN